VTPPDRRVLIVGSGTHHLSGISYYTHRLVCELSHVFGVDVILMRRLLPRRLYPGWARVGAPLADLKYPPSSRVFDGVDWGSPKSACKAVAFLWQVRPAYVVFQWWTGTVLHSYLVLALAARLAGSRVVIEFHETLDTGEARRKAVRFYVGTFFPLFARLASGAVVHSEFDRRRVANTPGLANRPTFVIPHGPYDQYAESAAERQRADVRRPAEPFRLLWFGVMRPFKGVDILVDAFSSLPEDVAAGMSLRIVGEVWEGYTLPLRRAAQSRYRDRISLRSEYIPDGEVAAEFAWADAVVLPYLRSSASGPLHIAMAHGLPVVVSDVGGLTEASSGYDGAIIVPAGDVDALATALIELRSLRGRRFTPPQSWVEIVDAYGRALHELATTTRTPKVRV
jgi:glycosyltransferase involved in cell wall biosynthesis